MLRVCDRLREEGDQLSQMLYSIFETARDSPPRQNPSIVARLEALTHRADKRLCTMVSYHDMQSQILVQMISDELQRIMADLHSAEAI